LLQQLGLGLVGQQQPAQAAGRVSQGGGDRVVAVQPDRALGNVRRMTLVVRALVVRALVVRALVVRALVVWARAGRTGGMSIARANRSLIPLALIPWALTSWTLTPLAWIPLPGFVIALRAWRVEALVRRSRPLLAMSVRQRRRTGMRARAATGRAGAAGRVGARAGRETGGAGAAFAG
jgi:hypothetical protein